MREFGVCMDFNLIAFWNGKKKESRLLEGLGRGSNLDVALSLASNAWVDSDVNQPGSKYGLALFDEILGG